MTDTAQTNELSNQAPTQPSAPVQPPKKTFFSKAGDFLKKNSLKIILGGLAVAGGVGAAAAGASVLGIALVSAGTLIGGGVAGTVAGLAGVVIGGITGLVGYFTGILPLKPNKSLGKATSDFAQTVAAVTFTTGALIGGFVGYNLTSAAIKKDFNDKAEKPAAVAAVPAFKAKPAVTLKI